jgi:hypothetical protein
MASIGLVQFENISMNYKRGNTLRMLQLQGSACLVQFESYNIEGCLRGCRVLLAAGRIIGDLRLNVRLQVGRYNRPPAAGY